MEEVSIKWAATSYMVLSSLSGVEAPLIQGNGEYSNSPLTSLIDCDEYQQSSWGQGRKLSILKAPKQIHQSLSPESVPNTL